MKILQCFLLLPLYRSFAFKQVRSLESVIHGHQIYKQIWQLLTLELEEGNNHDKFAVSLLKHATVLGHVPREFLGMFWHSSGTEGPSLV